jgi:hypothetical protein
MGAVRQNNFAIIIIGALALMPHDLDAMQIRTAFDCETRGSSRCFQTMRRPTRLSLRGGSGDAFWGRSYPWEAVGSPTVPLYYEVLGVNEDATLTDVSIHAESSSRTRTVSDVFYFRQIKAAYRRLVLEHHPDRYMPASSLSEYSPSYHIHWGVLIFDNSLAGISGVLQRPHQRPNSTLSRMLGTSWETNKQGRRTMSI